MNDALREITEGQFQAYSQLPWLMLLLFTVPLAVVAWKFRTYPTRMWTVVLGVSLIGSVFTVFTPDGFVWVMALDWLLLVVATVDLLSIYLGTNRGIHASREIVHSCSLGVPVESDLTIEPTVSSPVQINTACVFRPRGEPVFVAS